MCKGKHDGGVAPSAFRIRLHSIRSRQCRFPRTMSPRSLDRPPSLRISFFQCSRCGEKIRNESVALFRKETLDRV